MAALEERRGEPSERRRPLKMRKSERPGNDELRKGRW
jgi:hypothetical protein